MERTFKQIRPADVFVTNIDAGVLKWRAGERELLKNRPTGNELIDNLAELLSIHQMKSAAFYEKALGLHIGTLTHVMMLYSGMTFKDWRNQYIMLSAKEWLIETDYNIETIGKRMGFSGIYTFSKWFIRTAKNKPSYWRVNARETHRKREKEQFLQWKRENYKKNMQ